MYKYKWNICGRIDDEITYCFWCSSDNKPPKMVNSKDNREKQARNIFYDMKRGENLDISVDVPPISNPMTAFGFPFFSIS